MKQEEVIAVLHKNGCKVTPQRLAISELVLASKNHPTAEEIYQKVTEKHPAMSMATVYHTLNLLAKLGLLQELGFRNGSSRFDPNTAPHVNVVCSTCGSVFDYEMESVKDLWSHIVGELGIRPTGQRIDLYASECDQCRSKQSKKTAISA